MDGGPGSSSEEKSGWRCRSASDCPVEWLMQILSFVSLPDKFISKSVCKKWCVAAREVIEDQEEITFSRRKVWPSALQNAMQYANPCVPKPVQCGSGPLASSQSICTCKSYHNDISEREEMAMKMLSPMKRLRKIRILSHEFDPFENRFCNKHGNNVMVASFERIAKSLIHSNAQSLVLLHIPGSRIPLVTGKPVVYKRLKALKCDELAEEEVTACPRLQMVTVKSLSSLQHLPIENMRELRIVFDGFWKMEVVMTDEKDDLIHVVSRLVNLKVLEIGDEPDQDAGQEMDDAPPLKRRLIQGFHNLEDLSLRWFRWQVDENGRRTTRIPDDEFVDQLVQTNPNIRKLDCLFLTEAGIRSLSRLTNLTEIDGLRLTANDQVVPIMMILLTGRSRHCMKTVCFTRNGEAGDAEFPDQTIAQTELNAQLAGSGIVFIVDDWNENGYELEFTRES